jgi:hypothetical protein
MRHRRRRPSPRRPRRKEPGERARRNPAPAARPPRHRLRPPRRAAGPPRCFGRIAAGFGFGTPGPVNPPLSNDQISDKGIVTEARLEYEYFLSPFLAVGAKGLFGYHYFLGGTAINTSEGHSSGYQLAGFGTLTFHLGI